MVARVSTVAFQGIEGVPVDVQVMVAPGKVGMQIVGLPDKAVAESRERVQAALHASGLSLPAKKVTVNLAPADLPKEGIPLPHSWRYPFSRSLDFKGKIARFTKGYRYPFAVGTAHGFELRGRRRHA